MTAPVNLYELQLRAKLPQYLLQSLDEFEAATGEVLRRFLAEIEARPLPPLLYHYTGEGGLRGILGSGTLFCSDVFRQNDKKEIRHGINVAFDELIERGRKDPDLFRGYAGNIARFRRTHPMENVGNFYICSLTGQEESERQWRLYGASSRGFALAFDAMRLEVAFTQANGVPIENNNTFPVTYDRAIAARLQGEILDLIAPLLAPLRMGVLAQPSLDAYYNELAVVHLLAIVRFAMFFKARQWSAEREYRFQNLFSIDAKPTDVRLRPDPMGGAAIEYRAFDWRSVDPGCLSQIIIGPKADQDGGEALARELLQLHHPNPETVKVVQSTVGRHRRG
ncbi:DUF2971 domain-containing protein [Aestuariivirga litoralis]|uniref:DUF2971 domain-containing protein n=1 Tax=Aestuariivirga litoralis TaxID=2650924 RepID=UPI0018C60074|nr:DUF2971 domain-containing protein [Aestuariivirga litoralis]MBG1230901.1 DUF2971 domain-containing protein [Aestuariivirga litoralis]